MSFWEELKSFCKTIKKHPIFIVYIAAYCIVAYCLGALLGLVIGIVWLIVNLLILLL